MKTDNDDRTLRLMNNLTARVPIGGGYLIWIDLVLVAAGLGLAVIGFDLLLFNIAFVSILLAALRLPLGPFVLRAGLMGLLTSASLVAAVASGASDAQELWEIPGFGLAIAVVFVYSAHSNRQRRDLEAARLRMISAVSHDIRNPLTAAQGMATILNQPEGGFGARDIGEFAGTIAEAVEEALHLVEDLMTTSRLDSGDMKVEREMVDLVEISRSVVRRFGPDDSEIPVISDTEQAMGLGDDLRVRQVLRNLLTNANRYGGPEVKILVGVADGKAWLRVVDNGEGVPTEDRELIFEPFAQSGAGVKPSGSSGLGLANSRQLVEMMGGKLHYVRLEGRTVFELTIPQAPVAAVPALQTA